MCVSAGYGIESTILINVCAAALNRFVRNSLDIVALVGGFKGLDEAWMRVHSLSPPVGGISIFSKARPQGRATLIYL